MERLSFPAKGSFGLHSQESYVQTGQTSLKIKQWRGGTKVEESGGLPPVLELRGHSYMVTTVFVKYNYRQKQTGGNDLVNITVACLPNGLLQNTYNPDAEDTIWLVGRNAPSRGEVFRVRISFPRLKEKANWRVQRIQMLPAPHFLWGD